MKLNQHTDTWENLRAVYTIAYVFLQKKLLQNFLLLIIKLFIAVVSLIKSSLNMGIAGLWPAYWDAQPFIKSPDTCIVHISSNDYLQVWLRSFTYKTKNRIFCEVLAQNVMFVMHCTSIPSGNDQCLPPQLPKHTRFKRVTNFTVITAVKWLSWVIASGDQLKAP